MSAVPPPSYNAKYNESVSGGYQQQMPSSNPTIQVTQAPPIVSATVVAVGNFPVSCVCPHCQRSIVTVVEKNNGLIVWLIAGGLCLIGCFFGCCLIPFCIDELKDSIHYCPSCNTVIGQHKKL